MTICDLYTMPRVAEPVWLTMMSGASEKNQLCGHFMRELSLLMEQASKNQLSVFLYSHLVQDQSLNFCECRSLRGGIPSRDQVNYIKMHIVISHSGFRQLGSQHDWKKHAQ